jgi:predicted  nucleic acid-binding Zn-ribbon protein
MLETTEIEKKSLEAHVELCAERYNALESKMSVVDDKIASLKTMITEVRDIVAKMSDRRTDQLITWGVGIIGALTATIFWLLTHYVFK